MHFCVPQAHTRPFAAALRRRRIFPLCSSRTSGCCAPCSRSARRRSSALRTVRDRLRAAPDGSLPQAAPDGTFRKRPGAFASLARLADGAAPSATRRPADGTAPSAARPGTLPAPTAQRRPGGERSGTPARRPVGGTRSQREGSGRAEAAHRPDHPPETRADPRRSCAAAAMPDPGAPARAHGDRAGERRDAVDIRTYSPSKRRRTEAPNPPNAAAGQSQLAVSQPLHNKQTPPRWGRVLRKTHVSDGSRRRRPTSSSRR